VAKAPGMRGGGVRVGGGEQHVREVRGGAVLLARVPSRGLEGAQGRVRGGAIGRSSSGTGRRHRTMTPAGPPDSRVVAGKGHCTACPPCLICARL
jgi:hypothetical protein